MKRSAHGANACSTRIFLAFRAAKMRLVGGKYLQLYRVLKTVPKFALGTHRPPKA